MPAPLHPTRTYDRAQGPSQVIVVTLPPQVFTQSLTATLSFIGTFAKGLIYLRSFTATLFGGAGTGIGTQVNTDTFTRANETPLAGNWTTLTTGGATNFNLTTNTVVLNGGASNGWDCMARYNAWTSGNDQYSQANITVTSTSATSGGGVGVRMDSGGAQTAYRLVIDASGNYEVKKIVGGSSFTSLRTGTVTYVAGQKLGLSASGSSTTTLKVWYNGVQIGSNITDSSSPITSGQPSLMYSSTITGLVIDNWDGGTVGGSGPSVAFSRKPLKALTATLAPISALLKKIVDNGFGATLSFVVITSKRIVDSGFSATLSFVGNLARVRFATRVFTATVSFVGAINRKVIDSGFTATLSFVGALTKRIVDSGFTATLSFVGAIARNVRKSLTAALSWIGNIATNFIAGGGHVFTQSLTATLSFTGAAVKLPRKVFKATAFYFSSIFTDAFNRANGSLGTNWTSPIGTVTTGGGAEGTLQIVSNQVGAAVDDQHSYATWNSTFTDDQYAQITVPQIGSWTGVILRAEYGVDRFYQAFSFATNDFRIYRRWDGVYESLAVGTLVAWSAGDILRLEISGSVHPFSLRLYQNGVLCDQWTSPNSTYEKTGGNPGIGIYSPAGLNLRLDNFEGGNYNPVHVSDSFNRADGAIGSNWTHTTASGTTFVVTSNKVGVAAENLHCAAFWNAAAFADDQYGQFRWSVNSSYSGAVLRADTVLDRYYVGLVQSSTRITLLARWDGAYVTLADITTGISLSAGDMIRTEVTGSAHPITIKMYQNGQSILSWTSSSSTNVRAGGSPGIGIFSSTGAGMVLDDWEGGNLVSTTPTGLGVLTRKTSHLLAATQSFVGAVRKAIRDAGFAATQSFVGLLTASKSFLKSLTATLSFVGAMSAKIIATRAFTATLSFVGASSRRANKAFTATLSFVSAMVKRITDAGFTATLSFAGSTIKRIVDAGFSATLSFIGNLATNFIHGGTAFTKSLTASLSFVGTFSARIIATRAFTATLNATATLSRSTVKTFSAILSASASFVRRTAHAFSSTLTSAGALVKVIRDAGFTATLSFAGNLVGIAVHFFTRAFTATMTFVGSLGIARRFGRLLAASLNFSGAIQRRIGKVLPATLNFSTAARKTIRKVLRGTLSFIGFIFRGGAVTVLAGWITKCLASIGITGSTANAVRAGSQLTVEKLDESGVKIQVTSSQLTVERTK